MRIAQIAPLHESVPPLLYGGTERVVSNLTETLVDLGLDVTLYASCDSVTRAHLRGQCKRALRLESMCIDAMAHHTLMMEQVWQDAERYDLIHSHIDYGLYSLARRSHVPVVTTLHGRLDIPDLRPLYQEFFDVPLVSISDAQREPLPAVRWIGTVYHGLDPAMFPPVEVQGKYLAFLGRVSPEKRLEDAIDIAIRTNTPLKIAAKIDRADRDYFGTQIRHRLNHPLVEFIGEINEGAKAGFLGRALALIFPVDWPEPFGLAMIEAMACGTPVLARRRGSVPEVVDEGITGITFETNDEAYDAVGRVRSIDRRGCRQQFQRRFSARRMAEDYLNIYDRLLNQRPSGPLAEFALRG